MKFSIQKPKNSSYEKTRKSIISIFKKYIIKNNKFQARKTRISSFTLIKV